MTYATSAWERTVKVISEQKIFDVQVDDHLKKTKQDHLPQAALIKGVLDTLIEGEALEEAYMRGSFSYGVADELSDVDLFVVVDPENLDTAYEAATEYLKENYPIIVGCHDRLVKDYGGIGFMFICDNGEGSLTQLDLYFALKGVSPRAQLKESPRIYARDEKYFWVAEDGNDPLPPVAEKFIEKHTAGNDRTKKLDVLAREMIVTMSIMNKHLTRGQVFRASNDDNHATNLNIEMLSIISGQPESVHSPLYLADALVQQLADGGSSELAEIAETLQNSLTTPISSNKIAQHLDMMERIISTRGDKHRALLDSLEEARQTVFKDLAPSGDRADVIDISAARQRGSQPEDPSA